MRSVRDIASVPNKRAAQFYDVFVFAPCFAHWQFPSTNISIYPTCYTEKQSIHWDLYIYCLPEQCIKKLKDITYLLKNGYLFYLFLISDMIIFWNKHYCLHRVVEHIYHITYLIQYNINLNKKWNLLSNWEWWKKRKRKSRKRKLMLNSDIKRCVYIIWF